MKYLCFFIVLLLSACQPALNSPAENTPSTSDHIDRQRSKTPRPSVETPLLQPGMISNFDDGSCSIPGGFGWVASTDSLMGGSSTVKLSVEKDQDQGGYLRIRGEIATGAAFPWAGAILFPGKKPMDPVDGRALKTLRFSSRGRGTLRVLVFAESLGWIPAEYELRLDPDWKESAIQFSEFEGVDTGGIKAILFSGGPDPGSFEFDIDEVGFR